MLQHKEGVFKESSGLLGRFIHFFSTVYESTAERDQLFFYNETTNKVCDLTTPSIVSVCVFISKRLPGLGADALNQERQRADRPE